MSEYQYYEFQAVDRPLTKVEMSELRAISTRGRITSTQFQNVYNYGDLKGDPLHMMERYFDAHVYVANWGTHRLLLRLPRRSLDPALAAPYAVDGSVIMHSRGEVVILEITSDDEDDAGWVGDEESESWMPALLPLRADVASGDLRALYMAWLAGARAGMLDDDEREPPVPPGLRRLSAPLKALTDFLRLDEDLLTAAAEWSPDLPDAPSRSDLDRWITELAVSEKDALLIRVAEGDEIRVRAEILQRFRQEHSARIDPRAGGRTVAELLSAAEVRVEARRRQEATRKAAEDARRRQEQAAARAVYLAGLVGQQERLWQRVESLIETKRAKEYDQAVQLLRDLHDLSVRHERVDAFAARFGPLRERCASQRALLDRLARAGLRADGGHGKL